MLPVLAGLTALAVTNTLLHGEVTESSIRDSLSGLFNRRHLDTVVTNLDAVRARQTLDDRQRVSVVLFDLDQFGEFNKRFGHQTGDAVLRQFADVLRLRMRGEDIVARYGGEEFVVILAGAGLDEATKIAEEIRDRFAAGAIQSPDGSRVSATVSAGCAAMGALEPSPSCCRGPTWPWRSRSMAVGIAWWLPSPRSVDAEPPGGSLPRSAPAP